MSLRERQRRFAMGEVERVALDLFAARGYESVSVDDIVAAAGTSQRTFFRYFASKDEVVLAYERYLHERFVAALRSRPASEGPVRALANAFTSTSDVAAADMPTVLKRARVLAAAPVLRERAMGERRARIHEMFGGDVVETIGGSKVIEVRPRGVHKGLALQALVREEPMSTQFVAIGDDRTDEDLFEHLPATIGSGFTYEAQAFAGMVRGQDFAGFEQAARFSVDIAATLEAIARSARAGESVSL